MRVRVEWEGVESEVQCGLFFDCSCLSRYCTISNDSSPLCDCDTPDEIFISSPHQRACDRLKFSSGVVILHSNSNIFA
jgi:hypothetical protein